MVSIPETERLRTYITNQRTITPQYNLDCGDGSVSRTFASHALDHGSIPGRDRQNSVKWQLHYQTLGKMVI